MNDATKFPAGLFNFNDLSDLPEELQGKLHSDKDASAREWAEIVNAGVAAGFPRLSLKQIEAVATRAKIAVPTEQTIRGYLNRAVELKLIGKPTRSTYGDVKDHDENAADETPAPAAAPEAADPLSELGL